MEQAITAVACAASGLLQTNTRKPRSADKPRDSGLWENGLLDWDECEFKHKVTRVLVDRMYDAFVVLPKNQEEWETELKNFIENYEFSCVGA